MPEHKAGQTLRTNDHMQISKWAMERDAVPATVPGTEHGDRLGVLRFDFPRFGGRELRHVTWQEFYRSFDERDLTMIYQQTKTNGVQSNFFRFDNPHREDA